MKKSEKTVKAKKANKDKRSRLVIANHFELAEALGLSNADAIEWELDAKLLKQAPKVKK